MTTERARLYRPPAPLPASPRGALLRAILSAERDLITLLPGEAYRNLAGPLGVSRRGIFLASDPAVVRDLMVERVGDFPKNDLMVGALEPLVGEGLFISGGETWQRQRRMIDPAFSHIRINRAFEKMSGAVGDYERTLDRIAARGESFSLEAAMSHLTADIVCRTIFSRPLEEGTAAAVFRAFARFQRSVANVELRRLLLSKAWAKIPQPPAAVAAADEIRSLLDSMIGERIAAAGGLSDIAGDLIGARDPETGEGFTRRELIDQVGVFFLAGHETSASVLTWAFFILSQQPEAVARMRAEIERITAGGPLGFEHTKRLTFTRNVFRETLRLYPPVTFLARVALADTKIGGCAVRKGTMILISPWVIHRHERLWRDADRFDPDRFDPAREGEIPAGAYLPFGQGPRICSGAAFATLESTLILARLIRRYDFETLRPDRVRPVARLTTRPARDVRCRVRLAARDAPASPDLTFEAATA